MFMRQWPDFGRKKSASFLQAGQTTLALTLASNCHALVTLYVPFLTQIGQNLTGAFMRKIKTAPGNLFTES